MVPQSCQIDKIIHKCRDLSCTIEINIDGFYVQYTMTSKRLEDWGRDTCTGILMNFRLESYFCGGQGKPFEQPVPPTNTIQTRMKIPSPYMVII
jgi:hypothetical protein